MLKKLVHKKGVDLLKIFHFKPDLRKLAAGPGNVPGLLIAYRPKTFGTKTTADICLQLGRQDDFGTSCLLCQ